MLSTRVASPCQTLHELLAWRPRVNAYSWPNPSISSTAYAQCTEGLRLSAFNIIRVFVLNPLYIEDWECILRISSYHNLAINFRGQRTWRHSPCNSAPPNLNSCVIQMISSNLLWRRLDTRRRSHNAIFSELAISPVENVWQIQKCRQIKAKPGLGNYIALDVSLKSGWNPTLTPCS